ncbi:MAG: OmpH family outer membrane protein [Reyranellaceae bacterium]
MRTRALVAAAVLAVVPLTAAAQQPDRRQPRTPAPAVQPAPQPAPASPAAPGFNVGLVDISAVLRRSTAAQFLQRQMHAEQEKYQAEADRQQRSLQAEEEAIERQRPSVSADAYAESRREFQEKINRTTTDFRNRRRQIDEAFNRASAEINRTLQQVIEELARERSMELVVRREAVLFLQDGEDLTEPAAEALNRRLPQAAVELPAPLQ